MKSKLRVLLPLIAVLLVVLGGTGCTSKAKKAYHLSRAGRYYAAGQFSSAEIEYLNVLRWDPANTEAFSRLGLIYYDQGRLQRAMFFLSKASTMAPANLDLRIKLGYIESSVGQFSNALAQANYVLDQRPQDEDAPILLAEAAVRPKDAQTARQRLQALARNGDRAAFEVALGNLSLHDHDVAAAGAAFKKALALDPKSSAVNSALATLAWAQGDMKQADAYFKAAAEASPVRSPRRMQYVRFKLNTGDATAASDLLSEVIKSAPDYVPASLLLAEIAGAQKKFAEAQDLLDKVQKLDSDNFDLLFFQGQLDLAQGNANRAVIDMEHMARIYPSIPMVHYQLGMAYVSANDSPKAEASFERALETNPNYTDATLMLSQLQIRDGNADPAIVALEQVRQKQPGLVRAQLLLADAYRLRNRTSDSLAIYNSLENVYPTNAEIVLLHGSALKQLKDDAGARKTFERVLSLSPGNLQAIDELVHVDLAEKQFDDATQLINREIQAHPQSIPFRILAAETAFAQGKRDQTESILLQILQMDPANDAANLLLARLYSAAGQNEKALAKLNVVMVKNSQNVNALSLAAQIYDDNKDYKDEADSYEKVLKLNPKDGTALNNLACLYSGHLNNLDRAYELAQHARELYPFQPPIADTLGWICYQRGSYDAALSLLKESGAKLNDPEAQFHLGMASYMAGDETTARAALQRAWQAGSDFPGRTECGQCLSILNVNPASADATVRATLEKRVADKPSDPVARLRLARIYQQAGNTDQAIAAYEAVLQATPKNLEVMVNLTRLYSVKDVKKAYEMAKAAGKLAPYDAEVAHTLGHLAFLCGDLSLAASTLQLALQNQPNDPGLLFDYALAAYSIGKVSDAQTALQGALAQNLPSPQSAQARRMLDMIALTAAPAQASAASARIAEILKAEPDNVPALMAHAAASESGSDKAAAEQTCEKVLSEYPDFLPAEEQLARLYAAEPGKADRAYAMALKVHNALPDDPGAAKTLGIILVQHADYSHAAALLMPSAAQLSSDAEVFYYLGTAQFHLNNRADSKANLQQALALKLSDPLAASAKQMLTQLK